MLLTILTYLLLMVEVLCSILLIGVILLQRTKSQGAGLTFGAGMGESLFGSQVGNVLTRTTVVLAIVFLVNTSILAVLLPGRGRRSIADGIRDAPPPAAPPMIPPAAVPPAGGGLPPPAAEFPAVPEPAAAPAPAEPTASEPAPAAAEPAAPAPAPAVPAP